MKTDREFTAGCAHIKGSAMHHNIDEFKMMAICTVAITRHIYDLTKQVSWIANALQAPPAPEPTPEDEEPEVEDTPPPIVVARP